ncbi:type I polyketide synthase [Amycolatopsis sp. FDAARGOS 1241]|uniref:type I polyketide synthase n=1 Tax=Amycolatopsis sp. FDAARGOS 1241 TaxID=2778070 RepID=UPI00194F5F4C|nr:type I polyketide synthase [Amycolatopsis sp. FDAARGOS 1241]QRP47065.1 acyltransferase domain-containing protein [Amycolatopsis sp. FDAARGOS 1241]
MTAVAVVGLACRYPGAPDAGQYWSLLRAGREGITRFTADGLRAAGADPALTRQPGFVPAKGVLPGAAGFDWRFFGYSRAEAAGTDPQHRVFLECASAAIDDAGLDPSRFAGRIGVYGGAERFNPRGGEHAGPLARVIGAEKDFLTSRVAYKLGLRGPAVTVQTACSTSLTAVHFAVRALAGGECDAALAGGVAVFPPGECGYVYQEGGILSPDGHCRPFDERAAGTVPGEGVGVVVLKRLSDALADGDRIAAVIAGSAVNNDGGDKLGYTAPAVAGQSEVVRLAYEVAGIDPADLDYVEAHGTATRLGDPVELAALTDVFRASTAAPGSCGLGAVKSNLGHTGAAAGVAGLIKTVLMLEHGELVPTVHFGRPNPLLDLASSPFHVVTEAGPWPARGVRLAAVSAFGVGGTNAHVVLQEPPRRTLPAPSRRPRLLALSAATPDALAGLRAELAGHLGGAAEPPAFPAVARTLATRRMYRHRTAVVADDLDAAVARLGEAQAPVSDEPAKVAFLFPGQGVLRGPAGRAAYRLLPEFRSAFEEFRAAVLGADGPELGPVVGDGTAGEPWFADTVHQQLGLVSLAVALGAQLRDWGLRPAALFGNSVGEYAAAVLAGVWTPAEAARLVLARGRAMAATEPGRMASVRAEPDELAERLSGHPGVVMAITAPGATVLSGPESVMDGLLAGSTLSGLAVRELANRRAFHSASMVPAAAQLRPALAAIPARVPRIPMIADETGGWADPEHVRRPDYWLGQLCRPVRLGDGAATLLASSCDAVLELGPGSSMIATLRRHPAWRPGIAAVPLLGRAEDDAERALLQALGALWERGVDAVIGALDDGSVRVGLPGHPYAAEDPELVRPAAVRSSPVRAEAPRAELSGGSVWVGHPDTADPRLDGPAAAGSAPVQPVSADASDALDGGSVWVGHPHAAQNPELVRPAALWSAPVHAEAPRAELDGGNVPVGHPYPAENPELVRPTAVPGAELDGGSVPVGHPYAAQNPNRERTLTVGSAPVPAEAPGAELARLWCATLGVASAAESDDFFALGGESLLALDLCGAVSRTGRPVSVADFSRTPTFGGLLRLAGLGEAEAAAEPATRPLFLAADSTGTALPYRALTERLAGHRPVHGLDAPPGVTGIERIAAAHVAQLRRVQPAGPYTVGGWSFGAVVAHEMAVQLAAAGERVDTLVCLDGRPPDRPGWPIGGDPGHLAGTVRLQLAVLCGLGPAGGALRAAPELRRRMVRNLTALLRYRPRPVPGPVLLLTAAAGGPPPRRLYPRGVSIVPVPGDHWSMLAPPHVDELAATLRALLPPAEENPTRARPTEMADDVR